jgi:hypothetical protein
MAAETRTCVQAVHVNLEDKRAEEYTPPPQPAYVAYSGTGHTLR